MALLQFLSLKTTFSLNSVCFLNVFFATTPRCVAFQFTDASKIAKNIAMQKRLVAQDLKKISGSPLRREMLAYDGNCVLYMKIHPDNKEVC